MRFKEDFNQITVQETPGSIWIFGMFFVLVGGVFIYGSLGGFTNRDEIIAWQILLAFLMGASGIAAGVWIIYNAPATKVVINREIKSILHQRTGLFGRQTQTYQFNQLRKFSLIEELDDESSPIWSLGMELTSGEMIKISSLPNHSEKFKRDFVFQINEFLQKPIPSYKEAELLEDESKSKIG